MKVNENENNLSERPDNSYSKLDEKQKENVRLLDTEPIKLDKVRNKLDYSY